jgi:hypothetical protein
VSAPEFLVGRDLGDENDVPQADGDARPLLRPTVWRVASHCPRGLCIERINPEGQREVRPCWVHLGDRQ